jgi:zinc transporter ZupT
MQSNVQIGTFIAALLFAAIYIFGWRLHRARTPPAMLSLGAGATASYVFVRLLPELDEATTAFVAASAGRALPAPELRVYTSALLGFIVFYGLENLVVGARERPAPRTAVANGRIRYSCCTSAGLPSTRGWSRT